MTARTEIEHVVDVYFEQRPATLWGRAYDITDPERRALAKDWLIAQLGELAAISKTINGGATE